MGRGAVRAAPRPAASADRGRRDGRAREALQLERLHHEGELVHAPARELVGLEVSQSGGPTPPRAGSGTPAARARDGDWAAPAPAQDPPRPQRGPASPATPPP